MQSVFAGNLNIHMTSSLFSLVIRGTTSTNHTINNLLTEVDFHHYSCNLVQCHLPHLINQLGLLGPFLEYNIHLKFKTINIQENTQTSSYEIKCKYGKPF